MQKRSGGRGEKRARRREGGRASERPYLLAGPSGGEHLLAQIDGARAARQLLAD
jgi:hypothetical protein